MQRHRLELVRVLVAVLRVRVHDAAAHRVHAQRTLQRRAMKIIPLYDQGTVVYVMLPDDADLDRLWLADKIMIVKETK